MGPGAMKPCFVLTDAVLTQRLTDVSPRRRETFPSVPFMVYGSYSSITGKNLDDLVFIQVYELFRLSPVEFLPLMY